MEENVKFHKSMKTTDKNMVNVIKKLSKITFI